MQGFEEYKKKAKEKHDEDKYQKSKKKTDQEKFSLPPSFEQHKLKAELNSVTPPSEEEINREESCNILSLQQDKQKEESNVSFGEEEKNTQNKVTCFKIAYQQFKTTSRRLWIGGITLTFSFFTPLAIEFFIYRGVFKIDPTVRLSVDIISAVIFCMVLFALWKKLMPEHQQSIEELGQLSVPSLN